MQERPILPRCPEELLSSDLSGVCLRVWLAVRKVQGNNALAYARLDTYARMTGKNRAQVSRALKDLEAAGWMERTREGLACRLPEAPTEGNEHVTEVAESATLDDAGTVAESATGVAEMATGVAESATPSESGSESYSESREDEEEEAREAAPFGWLSPRDEQAYGDTLRDLLRSYPSVGGLHPAYARLVLRGRPGEVPVSLIAGASAEHGWERVLYALLVTQSARSPGPAYLASVLANLRRYGASPVPSHATPSPALRDHAARPGGDGSTAGAVRVHPAEFGLDDAAEQLRRIRAGRRAVAGAHGDRDA